MNLQEFWRSFAHNKGAVAGLFFMIIVGLLAILAPWVAPHSPIEQYREHFLQAPVWSAGGTSQFLFGTDELGRDLLSRLIHGARLSLLVGLVSVVLALIPGVILGLTAAFAGKWADAAIMRAIEDVLQTQAGRTADLKGSADTESCGKAIAAAIGWTVMWR